MDLVVLSIASMLGVYALSMILLYLLREKGDIFDPIPVSWAGYLIYIVLAMLSVSTSEVRRVSYDTRISGCALTVLATFCYTIGLYAGRGQLIARLIPAPAVSLNKGTFWVLWIISICGFLFTSFVSSYLNAPLARVFNGITLGFMGAATLISLLAMLSLKKSLFSKVIMIISSCFAVILFIQTFWSRRPLLGLAIAVLGFIYVFTFSGRRRAAKVAFVSVIVIFTLLLNLYLATSRGKRFYGRAAADQPFRPLSLDILTRLVPDVEIGYLAYEYALETIPSKYDYLYGSGIIPAFLFFIPRSLWPGKPVATGYFISQLWFGKPDPESNLSPLPTGELYINFGIFGLLLGTFLAGKAVRITNAYLRQHSENVVVWLAWLSIVPDFATEWRGDFTSISVQAFLRIIIFLGIVWLASRFFQQASR